ncbi:MAG: rhodanese-like domain-containing protein [Chromatiales bacterium]|nr:rhodanese-like domain-containing protein [Chromatiales bacterium]
MKKPVCLALFGLLVALPAFGEETPAVDVFEEYLEFAEYQGGNILPEQIPAAEWDKFFVVDTRRPEDYARDHIPGAVNIEWRKLVSRRDEIPQEQPVIVYCNTGSLSAQGAFALKVLGYENVKILTGGYDQFKAKGGLRAYERVGSPTF